MNQYNITKLKVFEERPNVCHLCLDAPATDLDHAIISKASGVRIDDPENLVPLCRDCNQTRPAEYWRDRDGYDHYSKWAFDMNSLHYGWEYMQEWYRSLDLETKEEMW